QQDNPAIQTGYRRLTYSWLGCFESLSWWHNETVNIWSHLLGALGVVAAYILLFHSTSQPQSAPEFAGIPAPFAAIYPFSITSKDDATLLGIFFLGAIVCFSCSAVFHSSLCHSQPVARYMNRVDYFGILALGTVNYFPTFHYAFFCAPRLRNLYIALMSLSGSTGIYLACSPTYATPQYRRMRTYTFFACGWVVIIPFVHAIWRYGVRPPTPSCAPRLGLQNTVARGQRIYLIPSERFPECRWPGRFDLVGSSHQIFHVCSLLAVWAHYAAVVVGFRHWRVERGGVCHA
ncbi:hemolysin-III related-domain-containing protein, partial [Mycena pura]